MANAESFAEEDKKRREAVDTKNQAESMIYQTEKQVKEFGEKVPAEVKTKIDDKVKALQTAVSSEDVATMKTSMDELQKEVMAMGQAMYSQQPEGAAPGGAKTGGEEKKGDDNVIDAEFTDDKDKKP